MSAYDQIIDEVEAYARQTGSDPAAVCRAATNNPRLWERLHRRVKMLDHNVERLRAYMAAHPAQKDRAAP